MEGSLLGGGLERFEDWVIVDLMVCSCSYCIAVDIRGYGDVLVVVHVYVCEHLFLIGVIQVHSLEFCFFICTE